jgi:hypothetical protein
MLKKLYVDDSLEAREEGGFAFKLKNNLATATIVAPPEVQIDGTPVDIAFELDGDSIPAEDITEDSPFDLDKGVEVRVVSDDEIEDGAHQIGIKAETDEWDTLDFDVEDTL